MLTPNDSGKMLTGEIRDTTIGTVKYSIFIIEAGSLSQIIHTALAINGMSHQWVTKEFNLVEWEAIAKAEIERFYPIEVTDADVIPKNNWA